MPLKAAIYSHSSVVSRSSLDLDADHLDSPYKRGLPTDGWSSVCLLWSSPYIHILLIREQEEEEPHENGHRLILGLILRCHFDVGRTDIILVVDKLTSEERQSPG